MALDVEMKAAMVETIGRRTVQRQHIRERHLPQIVVAHQQRFERRREVAPLAVDSVATLACVSFGAT